VLLALAGCFQTLESPVQPTPTPQGGVVAVQPTAVIPTIDPNQQPTNEPVQPTIEQPTLEQPTLATSPQVTDQGAPTPVETAPVVTDIPVQPTVQQPTLQQPTLEPTQVSGQANAPTQITAFPTEVPIPTQILPTDTPQPTETPLPTFTSTAAPSPVPTETLIPSPTFTSTVRVGPTIAPPQTGAMGVLDPDCTYHVEQDDRLYRISLRFNRTITELRQANPSIVNTDLIYLGQTLKIPECNIR